MAKMITQDHVFLKRLRKQTLSVISALADERRLVGFLRISVYLLNPGRVAVKGNTIVCLTCSSFTQVKFPLGKLPWGKISHITKFQVSLGS